MARRREEIADLWWVRVGPGGWAVVNKLIGDDEGDAYERVLVNVRADEAGRYRVLELHLVSSGEPITAEGLRTIRLGKIEDMLNLPEERAEIAARLEEEADPREIFATRSTVYRPVKGPRLIRKPAPPATTLSVPDGRGYSDAFYEQVADVYRRAFRQDRPPVEAVRSEANVPRSTAARWVKEARRRGLLAPAPAPGKKGG